MANIAIKYDMPRMLDAAKDPDPIARIASATNEVRTQDEKKPANEDSQGSDVSVKDDECPEGGLIAWLQVLGSFALYFNTWGTVNTFGVFQTFYENELLSHMSPSAISWIGSTQSFFLLVVGVVTGPLYDSGHLRSLLISGITLVVFGLMMVSICTEYWQVMLAQGACIGIGVGFLYIPSVALIPQYFDRRRALAMGLVVSGSSLGGVIYPLIFQGLQPRIGFGWTTRVMGLISLATLSVSLLCLRRRIKPAQIRSLVDLAAFKEVPYILYCAAVFFSNLGFFSPIFYLQPYALAHGLAGQPVALYLVAILNAASVPGRIAPSFIAQRIGPIQTLTLSFILTGVTTLAWINTWTAWGNVSFAACFGFFSGSIVALLAVVLASFTDIRYLGTRLGMSSVMNAIGALIGAPIAGAILRSGSGYVGMQLFSGIIMAGTALFLIGLRFSITGGRLRVIA